jgi:predicted transcriptional regulator
MDKKLLELSVDIVQAHASIGKMSGEEVESALIKTYNALHRMRRAEEEGRTVALDDNPSQRSFQNPGTATPDKIDSHASIQEDRVICLECGAEFRQLTSNHLKTHQLSPREYKRKWGFPLKQPLAAKVLTSLRSNSAKKRGLPQKLQQYLDDQRQKKGMSSNVVVEKERRAPTRRIVRR